MQFRADVLAGCNTGILLLLEVLAPGSLILADLGYFGFPWFDYSDRSRLLLGLASQGQDATYEIKEVLAYDDHSGMLDAIVWLGTYRADRAAHAVRLVIFCFHGTQYRYLTNVLDPHLVVDARDCATVQLVAGISNWPSNCSSANWGCTSGGAHEPKWC